MRRSLPEVLNLPGSYDLKNPHFSSIFLNIKNIKVFINEYSSIYFVFYKYFSESYTLKQVLAQVCFTACGVSLRRKGLIRILVRLKKSYTVCHFKTPSWYIYPYRMLIIFCTNYNFCCKNE